MSEASKKDHEAAKAEREARKAERDAAKAERKAARDLKKQEREAARASKGHGKPTDPRDHQPEDEDGAGSPAPSSLYIRAARYSASRATPPRFADALSCWKSIPRNRRPGTSLTPRTWRGTPNSSRIGRSSQP